MLYKQINFINEETAKYHIRNFIEEDSPNGDVTGDSIFDGSELSKAQVYCKSDTVLAGVGLIKLFFEEDTSVNEIFKDGDKLNVGSVIAEINGKTSTILKMERLFLNLLQRMCGIAYNTSKMVEIAKPFNVEVLDTRKTTPGLRMFEKYSVFAGGGTNHRYDLSSGILIKDNHIAASGGISNALKKVKSKVSGLPIEIEIDTFSQLEEALSEGVDALLLDNFSPDDTKKAVSLIRSSPNGEKIYVESSGGIDLSNINSYVVTGINAVSSGAITHSVSSADISLDFKY
ncbi:carboxylating nicotinate-nucleotide diphosphorylase [Candidatus Kapabacteria bacterium]|nr:carboxylating nicotinate-nucleotide diphosphorylase [Candidatus Kapabacteria bacterium]